ncbi:DUF58 domain-containing protein [Hydrogenimonas sp. SS33]|uniref:DUF58 domain-containing protein n=1 Tax=Hydrogenimonas leucolamina TaxID=2954236 RepID=UPI00336BB318
MNSFRTFLSLRRKIRQRPTLGSLILLLLLLGLFLEAYMHNFNLVYITLFFLFAFALVAAPVGILNIGGVEAQWEGCGRLFAHRKGKCRLLFKNPGSSDAYGLDLLCCERRFPLPPLPAGKCESFGAEISPRRRGLHETGPIALESRYPLGTVRFKRDLLPSQNYVVYPEPAGKPLEYYLRERTSSFGHESDFEGLKGYSGSESASRIHWPSVARGEAMVKRFETQHSSETLEFDFLACGPDTETRLSQLTLWVLECEKRGLPFRIKIKNRLLESPKESIDEILKTLATY